MKALLLLLLSVTVFAQSPEMSKKAPDQLPAEVVPKPIEVEAKAEASKEVKQDVSSSAYLRENATGTGMVGYEWLSTWIPLKVNLSYSHILSRKWTLEGEYARGHLGLSVYGFDAFTVNEQRYSLIARNYTGNSFHWIFGLFKHDLYAKVGDDLLAGMSGTPQDDFRVQSIGAVVGFGNRWQWGSGFTFGIDWFRMNQPLFAKKADSSIVGKISNDSDADSIQRWINRVKNIPTFTLFGLKIGYTF